MKGMLMICLLVSTIGLASVPRPQRTPDPPLPDAKKFCHTMDDTKDAVMCTCATANDGNLCKTDDPLPYICKRMCGHAKDCRCCGIHK